MRSANINKFIFMGFMVMITAVGMGKVTSPLWITQDSHIQAPMDTFAVDSLKEKAVPSQDDWITHWINQDIIPSAEAAEGMALAEEQDMQRNDAAKIVEMRAQNKRLNTREKALDEREAIIKEAEQRAEHQIARLEQLEARIQSILKEEESIKDKKIKRLTAVYEGMKAERAAPVIAQMELGIVVKIFSRMSEKQVGKILSFLSPKQAVVISQALTQRIASVK